MQSAPFAAFVKLSDIEVADRLRPVDEAWVEALAISMADHGLDQAIVVRPIPGEAERVALVAGAHRIAAATRLGWAEIRCEVHEIDPQQARLVEIDENLMRRELGPLDRAIFLAERKRVWDVLHPETAKGGDRRSQKAKTKRQTLPFDAPATFTKEAATRVGLSERSVRLAIELAGNLSLDAIAWLRNTDWAENGALLRALAAEPAERQVALARLHAGGKAVTLKEAKLAVGDAPAGEGDPQEDIFRRLVKTWEAASKDTRRRFMKHADLRAKVERVTMPTIGEVLAQERAALAASPPGEEAAS